MLSGTVTIHRLLSAMGKLDASDLHIKVGIPPTFRVGGELRASNADPISADEADHLLDPVVPASLHEQFQQQGSLDFAVHHGGERFRINMFRAGGHTHAAIRRVRTTVPTFEALNLPPIYRTLAEETTEGLVIVCGVTGCGKSTTLAAMIDHVNSLRHEHIVTIEDPVEFVFEPRHSIISQREVGIDVPDFPTAMRAVVREDPDVIFVGEMRDRETITAGLQAAETGHLVFATLHTADAAQSIPRLMEFFPESEREFMRGGLATSLRAVCAQRLLPSLEGGVVPATEVLLTSPSVRDAIREHRDEDLSGIIAASRGEGMHSFTQSLAQLVQQERVDLHTAMDHAPNRNALDSLLKGVEVKASGLVGRGRG